jgi:signal transduction histidine kinase
MVSAQIQFVIVTLIANVISATPGKISRRVLIAVREEGESLKVSIVDSGGGVSDEMAKLLLAPPDTAGINTQNFGLSACQHVIKEHDGVLSAERNPGGGTTIAFTLPVCRSR